MGTRALIYTRVSNDQAGGRSPDEQEAEARQVCQREGWDVVEVVTDSVGASRHSKGKRHGWDRARRLVADGVVDTLVTWEASRAQRDLAAYADLRELCARSGVKWCYSGRIYDMADSGDRFTTGLDALLAEREADSTADRVRRAMRSNAQKGRPHGRRLFGYLRIYDETTGEFVEQVEHPDEAPIVRRIFDDYLSGHGLRTLGNRLNEDGLTTSTGGKWNDPAVKRVLVNPAYIGQRVHRGEVVGVGDWPALVDQDRFDRVAKRLVEQRTSKTRQRVTARLLTGVGRCGKCGGKIVAGHDRKHRRTYICKDKFCVGRDLLKLDEYVTAIVLGRLAQPDVSEALAGAASDPAVDAARERAETLRHQLDEAVDAFAAGNLTAATLSKVESRLLPGIEQAEREARKALVPLEIDVPKKGLETWWENLTPVMRREVVGTLLAAVVVLPTQRGSRTFDPDAIRIEWRR